MKQESHSQMSPTHKQLTGYSCMSQADLRFHKRMAIVCLVLIILSVVGCCLTSIQVHPGRLMIGVITLFAMLSPLPLYWHQKGRRNLRESTLVIPWEVVLAATLPFPVLIAARLHMPLQDTLFGHIDQALGVNVPAIQFWAGHHWLGTAINKTYPWLLELLAAAAFVPALCGKLKHARGFLLANVAAFTIGLPLFAFLPAVGPWYFYHLPPNAIHAHCQAQLFALRSSGTYSDLAEGAGIVCFPSFHVIWAILCAAALWGFRYLRIPLAIFSCMIIASTLTTGWHYFTDVLAGTVIALISLLFAWYCTREIEFSAQQYEVQPASTYAESVPVAE